MRWDSSIFVVFLPRERWECWDGESPQLWAKIVDGLPLENLKFSLNAALDTNINLHRWRRKAQHTFPLYSSNQSLTYNSPTAMNLCRYSMRHDKVLAVLGDFKDLLKCSCSFSLLTFQSHLTCFPNTLPQQTYVLMLCGSVTRDGSCGCLISQSALSLKWKKLNRGSKWSMKICLRLAAVDWANDDWGWVERDSCTFYERLKAVLKASQKDTHALYMNVIRTILESYKIWWSRNHQLFFYFILLTLFFFMTFFISYLALFVFFCGTRLGSNTVGVSSLDHTSPHLFLY